MDAQKVTELKKFIATVEAMPDLIHTPQLSFFKEYLTKLGANIPAPSGKAPKADSPKTSPKFEPETRSPKAAPVVEEESEEEESEEEVIEDFKDDAENDADRLKAEDTPLPKMAPEGKDELNDADMDKQCDLKQQAAEAQEDGDLAKALDLFSQAIELGGVTAMMYTKRADMLLKSKRPMAAINDCDAALKLNPDSAKGYRIRGTANRKLGNWLKAKEDLSQAQKCDFDDNTEDVLKEVLKKTKEIEAIDVKKRALAEKKKKK